MDGIDLMDAMDGMKVGGVTKGRRLLRAMFFFAEAFAISALIFRNEYPFQKIPEVRPLVWPMFFSFLSLPIFTFLLLKKDTALAVMAAITFFILVLLGPMRW